MKTCCFILFSLLSILVVHSQELNTSIFNSFKQGNVEIGGNCVSIALIKAAFSKHGHKNVFKQVTIENNQYNIVMRDEFSLTLTEEELNTASSLANFKLKDSTKFAKKLLEKAQFCFAAMCKRNQKMEAYNTFKEAILDLNNGYPTKYSNHLLGLKFEKIKPHRASKIDKLEHLVIYNTYHAVYASNGYYDECWNESGTEKIKNLKWKRFGLKCAWKGCAISGAFRIID